MSEKNVREATLQTNKITSLYHLTRLLFIKSKFLNLPSTLFLFPLAPGHNTVLCSILPYESSSSTQLSWCTRLVIIMTAVCSLQYMLSEVKDCTPASSYPSLNFHYNVENGRKNRRKNKTREKISPSLSL